MLNYGSPIPVSPCCFLRLQGIPSIILQLQKFGHCKILFEFLHQFSSYKSTSIVSLHRLVLHCLFTVQCFQLHPDVSPLFVTFQVSSLLPKRLQALIGMPKLPVKSPYLYSATLFCPGTTDSTRHLSSSVLHFFVFLSQLC